MWEKLRLALIAMARDPEAALGGQLGDSLAELGRSLRSDPALQWQVNRFARRTLVGVATRYGEQIVQLVSETVRRWDAQHRSPTGSRARSGATCSSSASTARWSAAWSASRSTRLSSGCERARRRCVTERLELYVPAQRRPLARCTR